MDEINLAIERVTYRETDGATDWETYRATDRATYEATYQAADRATVQAIDQILQMLKKLPAVPRLNQFSWL